MKQAGIHPFILSWERYLKGLNKKPFASSIYFIEKIKKFKKPNDSKQVCRDYCSAEPSIIYSHSFLSHVFSSYRIKFFWAYPELPLHL